MSVLLPFEIAKQANVLLAGDKPPYTLLYSQLTDIDLLSEIQRRYGVLNFEQLADDVLRQKVQKFYENNSSHDLSSMQDSIEQEEVLHNIASDLHEPLELLNSDDEAPIIRLINALFAQAILENASDIHLEPYEKHMRIRFRIHGRLKQVMELDIKTAPLLISRVKVMARLDIAEKRIPQDGRISIQLGDRPVDIRISTIPSGYSEKVVMRLLDRQVGRLDLSSLGMDEQQYQVFSELLKKPHGIILVTGPTGSGKTTTLYAALETLNQTKRNIMTVEDPIEYHIDGINQTQINTKIQMTFAKGLRAILRQDPDVVMVGEIRDNETAKIAVQASLTGHLVFSTLHTNNTISTIVRLLDMGLESYLLSSSLEAVIAQRLVRKLCPHCKAEIQIDDPDQLQLLGEDSAVTLYQAQGCSKCAHQGYGGRVAIYELLLLNDALKQAIAQAKGEQEIRQIASAELVTLKDQAVELAKQGVIDFEEALLIGLS